MLMAACLAAIVACQRVGEPDRARPLPPADLLLEASLPDLEGGLAGVTAYAERVQWAGLLDRPARLNELARAAGLRDLDGARRDRPLRLLVLDPRPHGSANAILVAVGDVEKLRAAADGAVIRVEDGYALAGDAAAVERLAPYAFGTLVHRAPAPVPDVLLYAPIALTTFGPMIEAQRKQMKAMLGPPGQPGFLDDMLDSEFAILSGLLRQSTVIEFRVEASAEAIGVDIAFSPRSGSELSGLVSTQKPSTYALLQQLPARSSAPGLVVAGHLELGGFRAQVRATVEASLGRLLGVTLDDDLRAALGAWLDQLEGELAVAGQVGKLGPRADALLGTDAGASAMEKLRAVFQRLAAAGTRPVEFGPMRMLLSANLNAGSHDGVGLMSYDLKYDLSTLPPDAATALQKGGYGDGFRVVAGGWDEVQGFAVGFDGADSVAGLIDASRSKAARLDLPPGLVRLFEASRARKESLAMVLNLGFSMAPGAVPSRSGLLLALGFADRRMHVRVALPAEHFIDLRAARAGAAAP
jgi:hypothetical protein